MNTRDVDIFGYSLGGSVSEMMNPVERRLPELTPAQIANLTASLAPGAASVDIAGEFPEFPSREMTTEEMLAGPRAPSLAENLAEGKYFSGIMQALGGLGDAATVIPAVGPLIGGILKTPRALQRLQRAKEAGFDTDTVYYHGADDNITEFRMPSRETGQTKTVGTGVFMTSSPEVAGSYAKTKNAVTYPVFIKKSEFVTVRPAKKGQFWNDISTDGLVAEFPDGTTKPASEVFDLDDSNTNTDELSRVARSKGFKGLIIEDVIDIGTGGAGEYRYASKYLQDRGYDVSLPIGTTKESYEKLEAVPDDILAAARAYAEEQLMRPADVVVSFDPKNIRSVNAKFEELDTAEILKASGGAVSKFAEGGIAELLESRSRFEDPLNRLTQPISADLGPLQMAIPQEEGLRQRAERVLAGLMGDEREDFRRAEKALTAADVLPVLGDVGAAADVRDALSEDDLMGAGIAAISFLPVAGGMAAKGLKSLRDQAPDDGLQFLMNIGPEGIEKAQRLGGFPMPSLAVTRQDLPFESFGEITLVGAPTKFDPGKIKANVVFNADAYTVRAPQPFRIAKKDADLDFQEKYRPISKEFGEGRADQTVYELGKQELKKTATEGSFDSVFRFLQRDPVADVAFLRDQGDNRPIPTRASGLIEQDELRKMVQEYGDARKIWADQELDKYFDREEVFDASVTRDYYTGKGRIFKPYTGEEVVKFMKKRRGAAQEQGAFSVSPGKLRASLTERLGSFKKMRDQSSRLVDNEAFTKFKDESYEKVVELAQSLKPFYKFDSDRFGFPDEVIEMLIESERRSLPRALDEFGFEEVPDYVLDDIREVKSYFRNAPTEYFEAKPQRLVDLSEFEGAIVPQDTPARILKAFQDAGIQVEYYTDNAERLAARKKFAGTAFSVAGGITLIGAQTQQEDFDMNLGIGSI